MSRFGTIFKLQLDEIRLHVTTRFHIEGSALAGTIRSRALEFDCQVLISSPEPADRIARLVRTAHNSCFVLQSLLAPVTINRSTTLNGQPLPVSEVAAAS